VALPRRLLLVLLQTVPLSDRYLDSGFGVNALLVIHFSGRI